MKVRSEVRDLAGLGPLPLEEGATESEVFRHQALLEGIDRPVTDDEARELAKLFPARGSCFGLAWRLVHLIETAPGWPLPDVLQRDATNEWIVILRQAVENTLAQGRPIDPENE